MTVLDFSIDNMEVEPYAVTPNLTVRLRMSESTGTTVRAVALRAQVRIEPHRRPYSDAEGEAAGVPETTDDAGVDSSTFMGKALRPAFESRTFA